MGYNFVTNPASCYVDIPILLYYSHIPTVLIALFIGFFVFLKNKSLASKILFFISFAFSLWSISDIVLFSAHDGRTIMLFWSFINLLEMLVSVSTLYFAYVFLENKDASFRLKVFFGTLLSLFIFLIPTKLNIPSFTSTSCEAQQGILNYYFYFLESFFFVWLVIYLIRKIKNSGKGVARQRIVYFSIGTIAFLVSFSGANIISSALTALNITVFSGNNGNWLMLQYGLLGMPIFMGFLAYLIVRYKAFNIKLIGTQALVVLSALLIGALLFYVQDTGGKILILINLALSIGFGYILVKSVKKEVEQKEALEVANKEITEKKEHLEIANAEISKRGEELQKMAYSLDNANQELKITNNKLIELDKAKADFIGLANHQLKHAPTTIKSFMSMLLEGDYGQVPESQIKVLKNVNDANERQIHLANDLLEIIKMESNKVQLDFQKQRIEDVCQGVFDNLSATAKEKNLQLSYEKPKQALPEVLFDKSKVFEAIFNFVDNAVKYTPKGSITIKTEFAPSSNYKPQNSDDADKKPIQGSVVRVIVSDTGSGISKEHLGQLFAKFSRKDTAKLNSGGTGLGLYLVKLMIEAHGGRTWAESEGEGKGSRFIMELPVKPAAAVA